MKVILDTSRRLDGDMRLPQNRNAFLKKLGIPDLPLVLTDQVHGNAVEMLQNLPKGRVKGKDGLITTNPGLALGIFTADCLPVFFWTEGTVAERGSVTRRRRVAVPDQRAVGIAHIGWRGAHVNLAKSMVEGFKNLDIQPQELRVSIGPHIRSCCYKIQPEVAKLFPSFSLESRDGNVFLNIERVVKDQLVQEGVEDSRVRSDAPCTCSNSQEYFSFRRDKSSQSLLSVIAFLT